MTFIREPRNQYDPNALRADLKGRCAGYLRRPLAAKLAPQLTRRASAPSQCAVSSAAGQRAPTLGVHVWLERTLTPGLDLEVGIRRISGRGVTADGS